MNRITTVLVANRGEIAVRVMRTAKALGMQTVAVYSDADAQAMHVREADTAVHIGPSPVADSYLRSEAIIAAAKSTGADAIHPGYGFLSENQAFAIACEQAGITFIGPPNHAIDVMGDKARAKRAMLKAGVPCIPGYQGEDQSVATLVDEAAKIGLPVMVKAAAGGGGRGMRLVAEAARLEQAIELAQSEAENAFGSREVIIEKALLRPRHVEIQVFGDQHGNLVHLGERDCSIQRRHQKVVEESPCPVMTPELRQAMGAAAVEAARAVDYVGAGTVEFLLDESGDFYFLEMNTRLQVEHPVTECVTGFDLVEWQLRVARGEALPVTQSEIELHGHAIEVRLYAEDPSAGFLPSTGPVQLFHVPCREGLRVDTGVETGDAVSPFYDAMVAKIIASGTTREDARARLLAGMRDLALLGLANNRDFLIDVLAQPEFAEGKATTAFIEDHYGDSFAPPVVDGTTLAAAAVIQHRHARSRCHAYAPTVSDELLDWSSTGQLAMTYDYSLNDTNCTVVLRAGTETEYTLEVAGVPYSVSVESLDDTVARLQINDRVHRVTFRVEDPLTLHMATPGVTLTLTDLARLPPDSADDSAGGSVLAPMHGQLLSVEVVAGQQVVKGDRLAVLEAMKMQHEITALVSGVVTEVAGSPGTQIAAGDLILTIEEVE